MPDVPETTVEHHSSLTGNELPLLDRLKAYATAAIGRQVTASLVNSLVNFQKFLVLSYCEVLLKMGTIEADV